MKKLRITLILAILAALMIPIAVQAAGAFYCSANRTTDGAGTYANPWACSTQEQLDYVIYDLVCQTYHGGVLFRMFPTSYVFYEIAWLGPNIQEPCSIVRQIEYPGRPPRTGVEVPAPLIASLAVFAALALGGVGMILRRKTA